MNAMPPDLISDLPVEVRAEVKTDPNEPEPRLDLCSMDVPFPWSPPDGLIERDHGALDPVSEGYALAVNSLKRKNNNPSDTLLMKKELRAFKESCWASITGNGTASTNVLQIYVDLRTLVGKNRSPAVVTIAEQLLTFLPPLNHPVPGSSQHPVPAHATPERTEVMTKLSEWLRRQSDDVVSGELGHMAHCDSLKVLRFIIRCAHPDDDVRGAMELIFEGVLSTNVLVQVEATRCLNLLAELHSATLPSLFIQHIGVLGRRLAMNVLGKSEGELYLRLNACNHNFHFGNTEEFLQHVMPHLLQPLIFDGSDAAVEVIRYVAAMFSYQPASLLMNFLEFVLPVIIIQAENEADLEASLQFLEKTTKKTRARVFSSDHYHQRIYNELFLNLESKPIPVLRGIKFIAQIQGISVDYQSETDLASLADYLQPKFLGFIFYADAKFSTTEIDLKVKRRLLQSLSRLIEFMGPRHMSSIRTKLLATLKTVLQTAPAELLPACFSTWSSFIRTLDTASIKPILSQIVVILLPFVRTNADHVVPVLKYLIVENERALRDHFQELFFLPDIPELADVTTTLRQYVHRTENSSHFGQYLMEAVQFVDIMDRSQSNVPVTHNLSLPVPADHRLRIPQIEVKQYALKKLKLLIRNNQAIMYNMIRGANQQQSASGSTSADANTIQEYIMKLMSVLINGCREAYSPLERQGFAEVFGAVGALDPDCVELPESRQMIPEKTCFSIHQPEFASNFLKELVKGYMTSEKTRTQDTFGFIIQETLKFYELNDDDTPTGQERVRHLSSPLWKDLGPDYQEVLSPFLTSKYTVIPMQDDERHPLPIFRPRSSLVFSEWMRDWTVSLIDRITTDTVTSHFFLKCGKLLQTDLNRCLILLPHIVVYLLLFGDAEVTKDIELEMMTVLRCHEHAQDYDLDLRHFATQTVLSLVEFLREWSGHKKDCVQAVRNEQLLIDPNEATLDLSVERIQKIRMFLKAISEEILAKAWFSCGAYAKALVHYESFLREGDKLLQKWSGNSNHIQFLQRIYVNLEETDGIRGLNASRVSEPSVEDRIVLHLSSGNLQEALICYEQLAQSAPKHSLPDQHASVARCLLDLDEPTTAMAYCNGILSEAPDWMDELNPFRIEAAWKLSRWDALENYLDVEDGHAMSTNQFSVGVGKLLLSAKAQNSAKDCFQRSMAQLRAQLMGPVVAVSMEKRAYHRAYDHLVQLHILQELEEGASTWFGINSEEEFHCPAKSPEQLLSEWRLRLNITQPSYRNTQKILTVRRIIMEATKNEALRPEIGHCWLQSAKTARKSNYLQTAYSFLLNAISYAPKDLPREHAKYLWMKGDRDQAMASLEKAVRDHRFLAQDKLFQAKVKLLSVRYHDEAHSLESSELCQRYQDVAKLAPEIEKSHFYLGQFYDKILENMDMKKMEHYGEQVHAAIEQYVASLRYGCQYIHQSLPRLLSFWLDFGAAYIEHYPLRRSKDTAPSDVVNWFNQIQNQIRLAIKHVPKYVFLVAFPQLISRICNPNEQVFLVLTELIAKVTQAFPQIAMWHLAPVSLSTKQSRRDRYARIMEFIKRDKNGEHLKFFTNMERFCQHCVTLCNLKVSEKCTSATLSEFESSRALRNLMRDTNWMHPLLPFRAMMNPLLPSAGSKGYSGLHGKEHDPFPTRLITICDIADKFDVLSSLQRPKKISVTDSDGHSHSLMLKPKDDLRKDSRFMELVELVNKFLREDSECRSRQLHIRSYSVIPLNEDCGIVEWVPNVMPFRSIVVDLYKRLRNIDLNRDKEELRNYHMSREAPMDQRLKLLRDLLSKYQPILYIWMQRTFPDAAMWLTARLTFARTCAVMSIVGYIMGLGDRHGENLLLDGTNAAVVHCDFSCLFNKGETLDWPERVPFRLTPNMVDAMGPLGVEGFYRQACELTLKVIREQKNAMVSVLKTFLYDPLVEWQDGTKRAGVLGGARSNETGESQNEEAQSHLDRIKQRISGQIRVSSGNAGSSSAFYSGMVERPAGSNGVEIPLSVPGQVNYLIREATSERLLCQMYAGWSPFL